jgi:hypothetical protein
MPTTVFYAWQSDRNERHCRYLIRDAAKKAVKKLSGHGSVREAPSLDHDTKDEPGTPHIAETIQRKIRRCGIFLADLTSVANYLSADKRRKKTPNANVLLELGIAIRSVGWKRILLVMNTEYGDPDGLPFDLKHHSFPITYKLAEGGDVKAVQAELTQRLFSKLDLIVKSGVIEMAKTPKVKVQTHIKIWNDSRKGRGHVRWLQIDVVNDGIDLNNLFVTLDYPGKDGKIIRHPLDGVGKVPEPFKTGYSCQFVARNGDPSKPWEVIKDVPTEQVAIVVHSRVREVARIPATKWLKTLDEFRLANPLLPPKPPPKPARRRVYSLDDNRGHDPSYS